jgi:hypothetical protein
MCGWRVTCHGAKQSKQFVGGAAVGVVHVIVGLRVHEWDWMASDKFFICSPVGPCAPDLLHC